MSSIISNKISTYFDTLCIGPPSYTKNGTLNNVVAYPLFPSFLAKKSSRIITLGEALANGLEIVDTGIINRIQAYNHNNASVLAKESEILLGETQERSIQFSCILPPFKKTSIAVSCVEEGRPAIPNQKFTDHGACPWTIRSFKNEQLARNGEPTQFWVWERIRKFLRDTKTESSTHSLYNSIKKYNQKLISLSSSYPISQGQVGVVFNVGNSLYIESFSDPEIFAESYKGTVYSALSEALFLPSDQIIDPNNLPILFERIKQITKNVSTLKNSRGHVGQTITFGEPFLSGQALFNEKGLVHLSGHQRCLGKNKKFTAILSELNSAQSRWEKSSPVFLSEIRSIYRNRKICYDNFKKQLRRSSNLKIESQKKFNNYPKQHSSNGTKFKIRPFSKTMLELFVHIFRNNRD